MNPGRIAPSILSFDLSRLSETVPAMVAAGAEVIHFDVMDGQFVPPITFGDCMVRSLRDKTDALFEVHLMVENPDRQFASFAEAGAQRILFHAEATAHAHRLAQSVRDLGLEVGLAINPGTGIEPALEILDQLDMVLVMTVNPGWGGQAFLPRMTEKIARLREASPTLKIEVDGGIVPESARTCREAGADHFVVGSHLLRGSSVEEQVKELVCCVR